MKINHQIIGITNAVVTEFIEQVTYGDEKTIPAYVLQLERERSEHSFRSLVHATFWSVAAKHLGLAQSREVHQYGSQCLATAIEYFTTNWSSAAEYEEDRQCLVKNSSNERLRWSDVFHRAFLVAMLFGDTKAVTTLANWPESWMKNDPSDEDPAVGKVYVSVASAFRTIPLNGLEEMEAEITKTRSKGPKLLFQAWSAARSGDQKAFDKHLTASVQHFEKTLASPRIPEQYLAVNQSLVLAAAREKGMVIPELEPRLLARLITRESLGLD